MFYIRHHDYFTRYGIPLLQISMTCRICNKCNTTCIISGTGTAHHLETPVFSVAQSLIVCVVFCQPMFVFLVFFLLDIVLSVVRFEAYKLFL
jgi:hypothetical protein